MTSKSSFFKLMKEDLRQRLWTIVLASIVFILPIPIYIAMEISNYKGYHGYRDYLWFSEHLASALNHECIWLILVTIVGAVICAVNGFGYLFSKKKVDFFHSLPVKREKLFAVRYINGVLIYLVPYLVMILVSFAIIAISGHFTNVVFTTAMGGLLVHLLGYLTVYTTCILCVTFVGNIVVFFAVSGWTFGIVAIALILYTNFETWFFYTYSYHSDSFTERIHSLRFLSPGYFYIDAIVEASWSMLLQQLAFTVVLVVITLLVYRVRPSDGAGKAIAFPILKPILRISVEILAGACIGMLFYMATDSSKGPGWMIFGTILGVVLSHILIESIFYYDIRKCLSDKLSLAVCAAVSVGFVLVMRYDLFGYDTYLPKEKRLESVAIEVRGLDGYGYEIENMKLTDIDAAYPYLEMLVTDTEQFYNGLATMDERNNVISVDVAYHLKNGKTVCRSYRALGIHEELFAPVFESEEYKSFHYSDIYTLSSKDLKTAIARHAMNEQVMNLTTVEVEELLNVLRREISALTLKEKLDTFPVAELELITEYTTPARDYNGNMYTQYISNSYAVPIYASYTETLRFLKDRGFEATKEYEWTGNERVRMQFSAGMIKEGAVSSYPSDVSNPVTDYVIDDDGWTLVGKEIWYDEGDGTVTIAPEYWDEIYALCNWQNLYTYRSLTCNYYDDYRVYIDIPLDGYNNYMTYRFGIDKNADLSFLFE